MSVSAFAGCTGLTAVAIPETVKSIGNSAFMGTSIISIVIPKSVVFKAEDQSVFSGCKRLREVTILSESTVMPSYMFLNCSSLQTLEVPSCVTSLGVSFLANTSIERLPFRAVSPSSCRIPFPAVKSLLRSCFLPV